MLAGNHTLKAAISLGWAEIDAVLVDVDDERARKILLSSNRTAELGTYDDEALAELLAGLDGDYGGTGWSEEDATRLLAPDAEASAVLTGDAPTDEIPQSWGVVVECADEGEQAGLLEQLAAEGWKVRSLML